MSHAESVLDALMLMAREFGSTPTEIVFPTVVFLNIAADVEPARLFEARDHGVPMRVAYRAPREGRNDPFSEAVRHHETYRQVRVGDCFSLQGPCGPVTIREAKQ